jgi:hypothetical protein
MTALVLVDLADIDEQDVVVDQALAQLLHGDRLEHGTAS